jgi:DNA polymerase-3 subunit epsilon
MIRFGLSDDKKTFQAIFFEGYDETLKSQEIVDDAHRLAVILDTETTGIDRQHDEIIEIALRQFCFNRHTGEIIWHGTTYSGLQEASEPLSSDVKKVTGLSDEAIRGQKIDWQAVEQLVQPAALIIAHNAAFDRQFVDRYITATQTKIWACSFTQLDWSEYPVAKQPILALLHGFFYNGHRALNDIDALLKLLSMPSTALPEKSYLFELLENARKPYAFVHATKAAFEVKDILKENGYRWVNKTWSKKIHMEKVDEEMAFLAEKVYTSSANLAKVEPIALTDNFKVD